MSTFTITNHVKRGTETTVCAMITVAEDAAAAHEAFTKCFGAEAVDAIVAPGIDLNDGVLNGLFNRELLERVVEVDGLVQGSLFAKLTVSF